jgi:hypothetical protein
MLAGMAVRTLDLEVMHRGRREDTFQVSGDAGDAGWLSGQLRGWLELKRWSEPRWGEFELIAREAGTWKQLAKVRA